MAIEVREEKNKKKKKLVGNTVHSKTSGGSQQFLSENIVLLY